MSNRYRADELVIFASALLERAGMARDRSRTVADVLVEAARKRHPDVNTEFSYSLIFMRPSSRH